MNMLVKAAARGLLGSIAGCDVLPVATDENAIASLVARCSSSASARYERDLASGAIEGAGEVDAASSVAAFRDAFCSRLRELLSASTSAIDISKS